jgi:hypothetical protein
MPRVGAKHATSSCPRLPCSSMSVRGERNSGWLAHAGWGRHRPASATGAAVADLLRPPRNNKTGTPNNRRTIKQSIGPPFGHFGPSHPSPAPPTPGCRPSSSRCGPGAAARCSAARSGGEKSGATVAQFPAAPAGPARQGRRPPFHQDSAVARQPGGFLSGGRRGVQKPPSATATANHPAPPAPAHAGRARLRCQGDCLRFGVAPQAADGHQQGTSQAVVRGLWVPRTVLEGRTGLQEALGVLRAAKSLCVHDGACCQSAGAATEQRRAPPRCSDSIGCTACGRSTRTGGGRRPSLTRWHTPRRSPTPCPSPWGRAVRSRPA